MLVIGTGLLGASIGLGLRARGIEVLLSDLSPSDPPIEESGHDDDGVLVVSAKLPEKPRILIEKLVLEKLTLEKLVVEETKADVAQPAAVEDEDCEGLSDDAYAAALAC